MKTLVAPAETPTQLRSKTTRWAEAGLQLVVNISGMYVSHLISLDIWRSMTGH